MSADAVANKTMNIQLEEFLTYLNETKKASRNTVQAYIRDLSRFADYLSEQGVCSFTDADKQSVDGFKAALSVSGMSASTVSRALSAVRSLMQYYVFAGLMDSNPAREIHNDRSSKRPPVVLSLNDVKRLLSQPSGKDPKSLRDRAMLELLYATGMKASELTGMDLSDVNLPLSIIKCRSGGRERVIPIYPIAVKSLAEYINSARRLLVVNPAETALFVNASGDRMTRQGLWKILKIHASAAGLYAGITPHTLRHSFAAHLLENGADIHDIQEILGHTDISSTQRYAQFLKDYHKKGYMKFHPRA